MNKYHFIFRDSGATTIHLPVQEAGKLYLTDTKGVHIDASSPEEALENFSAAYPSAIFLGMFSTEISPYLVNSISEIN